MQGGGTRSHRLVPGQALDHAAVITPTITAAAAACVIRGEAEPMGLSKPELSMGALAPGLSVAVRGVSMSTL